MPSAMVSAEAREPACIMATLGFEEAEADAKRFEFDEKIPQKNVSTFP